MARILLAWIGHTDLRATKGSVEAGLGPIGQAVSARSFDAVHLLSDHSPEETKGYVAWLRRQGAKNVVVMPTSLSSPMNFGEVYERAVALAEEARGTHGQEAELIFHLSPGSPAMMAVWVILAKTRFPAELIQSSKEHGVQTASVPFDISADYLPHLLRRPDEELKRLSGSPAPEAPEFSDIAHRCQPMRRLIALARRVAIRSIPVLIEGESGTGKELFARAIHRASPRYGKPFIAVNCGAIPRDLVESELFGHVRGAFTGASKDRKGYFEAAHGGTLFLDEIGELPAPAQVKLLRVLQQGEIVRVGSIATIPVDVRIVAATNRTLSNEVREGRFREDLFYRLAVTILQIPPLRERPGDLGLLVERLLDQVNRESVGEPGYTPKTLSAGARNFLLNHTWPGNVRELLNTLRRAALYSQGDSIQAEEVREAILPAVQDRPVDILNRPLGEGCNLPDLLAELARHYLERALAEAHGNKSKAAQLVGLASYQTLTNWLGKYGVQPATGFTWAGSPKRRHP